jgi:hypothetical protein
MGVSMWGGLRRSAGPFQVICVLAAAVLAAGFSIPPLLPRPARGCRPPSPDISIELLHWPSMTCPSVSTMSRGGGGHELTSRTRQWDRRSLLYAPRWARNAGPRPPTIADAPPTAPIDGASMDRRYRRRPIGTATRRKFRPCAGRPRARHDLRPVLPRRAGRSRLCGRAGAGALLVRAGGRAWIERSSAPARAAGAVARMEP